MEEGTKMMSSSRSAAIGVVVVFVLLSGDWVEAGKTHSKLPTERQREKARNMIVGSTDVTVPGAELWGNWFFSRTIETTISREDLDNRWCSLWQVYQRLLEFGSNIENEGPKDKAGPLITGRGWDPYMTPVEEACNAKEHPADNDIQAMTKFAHTVNAFFDSHIRKLREHYPWWYGHVNGMRLGKDAVLSTAAPFIGVSQGMSGSGGSVGEALGPQGGIAGNGFGAFDGGGAFGLDGGGDDGLIAIVASGLLTTTAGVRSGGISTSAGAATVYTAGSDAMKVRETLATQSSWKWSLENDEQGEEWLSELHRDYFRDDADDSESSSGSSGDSESYDDDSSSSSSSE